MIKPKIVRIFSGVGGIDFGFEEAGFQTVFASDIWDKACESLQVNFKNCEVVCDDIVNIDFKKIKSKHNEIDGLVGGPPCPPFSKSRFYRTEKDRGIDDIMDKSLLEGGYFQEIDKSNVTAKKFKNRIFLGTDGNYYKSKKNKKGDYVWVLVEKK